MRRVAAPLAAALAALALSSCGGDGAEPGAPRGATLVLDFQPNAVHAGIYTALHRGYFDDAGVELEIREPSASTDAPKLLEAGRAELAILDINDLGLARERGLRLVGVAAIVQRPLASVIAADRDAVRTPRDLEGGQVGVTGLPSDDAVLDAVLESEGADPDRVRRVTIGFEAVSTLAAGRLDAATAFWNAEGVELSRLGIPTREFRVDRYGAPRYPELILTTSDDVLENDRELVCGTVEGLERGYKVLRREPQAALDSLLVEVPALDRASQRRQLDALARGNAFSPRLKAFAPQRQQSTASPALDDVGVFGWARWATERRLISFSASPRVVEGFMFDFGKRCRGRSSESGE
jgi:NitT/TauT family transport system substrate-binding protein/putative hydroxymethylpyrimidine transport system substrate-binding protein